MATGSTRFGQQASAKGQRYDAAVRHSGRVRLLRRAIPVGALLVVLGVGFFAFFNPFRALPGNISVGPLSVSGTKITMEAPKLSGFKKDKRPYEVTARWAASDVKNPNIIELKDIKARIALQERGFANVEALNGVYNSQAEAIQLKDDVRVKTDSGYDVTMRVADVNFKAGSVHSPEPVQLKFSGGTIDADSLEMLDNGQVVIFKGRVHTLMTSDQSDKPASQAKGTTP
ncbi:LPS export ABC transporter periplasmic protein LptC [Alsobacter soli]|uniref:LPS export ABC transporter periplasmic protein LptC n=1 Tax=Alsobacter soli TaxID=2109933 RepID=A0A2T1HQY4_9HYPH|nr:LPS export ABC transporter periplasmic protein LptC [Alsobacter soli]PSC04060.1 LPS export ABC transporter periplasmic protein LptC [Alsobacter soli]